jgi:hypothetical protein
LRGASAYTQATTRAWPASIACAAYCSIAPAVEPAAFMAFTSVKSSSPSDICSIGTMSAEEFALINNPSTSETDSPASSSASAIASAAKCVRLRP